MPQYIYKHPKKEKYIEVFQKMNDPHVHFDDDGLEWDRVFTLPQATIKEKIDVNNAKQFVELTKNKKGSVGDIMDMANEISNKRASRSDNGRDKLRDAAFDKWSKKRHGRKHPQDDR